MTLPKTDKEFQILLVSTLKKVCPIVYEGDYVGDEADSYITFTYYRRGLMFANGKPTASVWNCFVYLWVRKGVDAFPMREALPKAVLDMGATYPVEEIETDGEWKSYVFEFQYGGSV